MWSPGQFAQSRIWVEQRRRSSPPSGSGDDGGRGPRGPSPWKYVIAAVIASAILMVGCKYLKKLKKKKKKKSKRSETQTDAAVRRDIPDRAFMIGRSYRIRTPRSGAIPTTTMYKMKLSARKNALKRVRNYFKRKRPVRCLTEVKIEYRSELESYQLHVTRRGRRSWNYYTYKLPWTRASCIARGKLAGTIGRHLFMVENPHRNLFNR